MQRVRDVRTSAGVLYDCVLGGRYPPRTNRCDGTPHGSAPVANDPTSSEYLLRILCARWNKTNNRADDCAGLTLIVQSVMNPRARLWGAAVTYALKDLNLASTFHKAEFDPQLNAAVFRHPTDQRNILIQTDDGLGAVVANPGGTDEVYSVQVFMYAGRSARNANVRRRRPIITDYYAVPLSVDIRVTRL